VETSSKSFPAVFVGVGGCDGLGGQCGEGAKKTAWLYTECGADIISDPDVQESMLFERMLQRQGHHKNDLTKLLNT